MALHALPNIADYRRNHYCRGTSNYCRRVAAQLLVLIQMGQRILAQEYLTG